MFLTLIYRVRIYKALFNVCRYPVVIRKASIVILVSTYTEVFSVVVHYSWMSRNVYTIVGPFTLRSVFIAFLIIILVGIVPTFLINIRVIRHVNSVLLQALSTGHYYK